VAHFDVKLGGVIGHIAMCAEFPEIARPGQGPPQSN
jgi:hypothetical protein